MGVYETHEDSEIAYQLTTSLLKKNQNLKLIYVATANSLAVCRAVHACKKQGDVHVVATDVLKGIEPFVEDGTVMAILDQCLQKQGETSVKVLYKYLTEAVVNREEINVAPRLLLRSNILG